MTDNRFTSLKILSTSPGICLSNTRAKWCLSQFTGALSVGTELRVHLNDVIPHKMFFLVVVSFPPRVIVYKCGIILPEGKTLLLAREVSKPAVCLVLKLSQSV